MRYPISKPIRAKLVRFYYELLLVPGMEPRVVRTWADMVQRLLANKPGIKRKLELADLKLPWQPLWRALHKELWPKSRLLDQTYVRHLISQMIIDRRCRRNVINILFFVAECCKRYFPPDEVPNMLDTFLPLFTQEVDKRATVFGSKFNLFNLVCPHHGSSSDIVPTTNTCSPLSPCPFQDLGSF